MSSWMPRSVSIDAAALLRAVALAKKQKAAKLKVQKDKDEQTKWWNGITEKITRCITKDLEPVDPEDPEQSCQGGMFYQRFWVKLREVYATSLLSAEQMTAKDRKSAMETIVASPDRLRLFLELLIRPYASCGILTEEDVNNAVQEAFAS